jgi:hypothetical protein
MRLSPSSPKHQSASNKPQSPSATQTRAEQLSVRRDQINWVQTMIVYKLSAYLAFINIETQ